MWDFVFVVVRKVEGARVIQDLNVLTVQASLHSAQGCATAHGLGASSIKNHRGILCRRAHSFLSVLETLLVIGGSHQ